MDRKFAEPVLVALALMVASFAGALVSKQVRDGNLHWGWSIAVTLLPASVWAYQAQSKTMSLVNAAVLFVVVHESVWFLSYAVLGLKFSLVQLLGVGFLLSGLVLVNLA
jgi:drug/metabolite transporter (DMT)-like permease